MSVVPRARWAALSLLVGFACGKESTPDARPAFTLVDSLIAGVDSPYTDRQLQLKIRVSGLDTVHSHPLLEALSTVRGAPAGRNPPSDSQLVAALHDWLSAAEHLDGTRRAAAYLVADHVLTASWGPLRLRDRRRQPTRDRLAALGARSFFYEPAGGYRNAGTWEDDALRSDSTGVVGQYVLLRRIPRACWFSRTDAPFRWVIEVSEALLPRAATPGIAAQTDFYLGEAYRDIVALALGVQGAEEEAPKYREEATAARSRAIEHYRAALALDTTSAWSAGARKELNLLVAGLPPAGIRFYCFGGD
jgi:hypothetical protein